MQRKLATKRGWQTAYVKFAGIWEGEKSSKHTGKSDRKDAAVMTIVWCIFTEVKKALMRYLLFRCCGLTSNIPSLLVCILELWGLCLFRFQCFSQPSGAFKICFMHTKTTEKEEINYREKYIIQPYYRKKKKLFSGLFQSGNILCWCLGMS